MLTLLAAAALAVPPRGEVVMGWAGNGTQGYGFAMALPSVGRSDDASLVLRTSTSHLFYEYADTGGTTRVDSPGAGMGVGFKYAPKDLSLGFAVTAEARRTRRDLADGTVPIDIEIGPSISGDLYWKAHRRVAVSAIGSFSGANEYLWTRAGVLHQAIPRFKRGTPVALWIGADVTARGNKDTQALEGGFVAEFPIRDFHGAVGLRGGYGVEDVGLGLRKQATAGLGVYWSY